ncbi:hypothetical protein E2C01_006405 [Portunus trituberculatus]|uniref:Uncharacterized protein n=1 Tax=Portunus trituberculatus TaxID=210409 RepID=A0A5B7D1R3_PORTR|nr:hypothetical protein [Portunus trituberculatus]
MSPQYVYEPTVTPHSPLPPPPSILLPVLSGTITTSKVSNTRDVKLRNTSELITVTFLQVFLPKGVWMDEYKTAERLGMQLLAPLILTRGAVQVSATRVLDPLFFFRYRRAQGKNRSAL